MTRKIRPALTGPQVEALLGAVLSRETELVDRSHEDNPAAAVRELATLGRAAAELRRARRDRT